MGTKRASDEDIAELEKSVEHHNKRMMEELSALTAAQNKLAPIKFIHNLKKSDVVAVVKNLWAHTTIGELVRYRVIGEDRVDIVLKKSEPYGAETTLSIVGKGNYHTDHLYNGVRGIQTSERYHGGDGNEDIAKERDKIWYEIRELDWAPIRLELLEHVTDKDVEKLCEDMDFELTTETCYGRTWTAEVALPIVFVYILE